MIPNFWINVILSVTIVLDIFLVLLIFVKSTNKKIDNIFGLCAFFVSLWSLGILMFRISANIEQALFWNREFIIASAFIATTFFHFTLILTKRSLNIKKILLIHLPALTIIFLVFIPGLFIKNIVIQTWGKESIIGYLYPLFGLWYVIYSCASILILFREMLRTSGIFKTQLIYMIIASIGTYSIGMYFNLILILLGNYKYVWLGPCNSLFMLLIITYSILKHELLDIKLLVSKNAAYIILSLISFFSFCTINLTITDKWSLLFSNTSLSFLWIFYWTPLRKIIQTPLQEKWITDWYDENELMLKISDNLIPVFEKCKALEIIAEVIKNTIKLKSTCIYSNEDEIFNFFQSSRSILSAFDLAKKINIDSFKLNKNSIFLPLHSSDKLEGIIVLGQKISEDNFDTKDIKIFDLISKQALMVFDRMTPYEKIKNDYEKNIKYTEKVAQQASYATLTMGIAHEIRNPLQMLYGQAEIIEDKLNDTEAVLKFASITKNVVEKLTKLTENLLQFNKKKQSINNLININELIENISFLAEPKFNKTNVKIIKNLRNIKEIKGDQTGIYQIILNLILNASESIPNGGTIEISTIESSFKNKTGAIIQGIQISIRDTGTGISPENMEKIFDAFYSTKYQNTGIGLSIVLQLIDDHAGIIDVSSILNQGTTFNIYLPTNSD